MPYFVEYTSGAGAGRFVVEGPDFSSVLEKAKKALRGLDCLRAVLRFSSGPQSTFGHGPIRAVFTQQEGWRVEERRAEVSAVPCTSCSAWSL